MTNRKSGPNRPKSAQGSDKRTPETIEGATGILDPTPRRIDLSDLKDVRLELAHVYRKMDAGEIEAAEGTKRAYVLKTIHDVIVSAEIERRIADLEDAAAINSNARPGLPARTLN